MVSALSAKRKSDKRLKFQQMVHTDQIANMHQILYVSLNYYDAYGADRVWKLKHIQLSALLLFHAGILFKILMLIGSY